MEYGFFISFVNLSDLSGDFNHVIENVLTIDPLGDIFSKKNSGSCA